MTKKQLLLGSMVVVLSTAILLALLLYLINVIPQIQYGLRFLRFGTGVTICFGVVLSALSLWFIIRGALIASGISKMPTALEHIAIKPGIFLYAIIPAASGGILTLATGQIQWGFALISLSIPVTVLYTILGIRSLSSKIGREEL